LLTFRVRKLIEPVVQVPYIEVRLHTDDILYVNPVFGTIEERFAEKQVFRGERGEPRADIIDDSRSLCHGVVESCVREEQIDWQSAPAKPHLRCMFHLPFSIGSVANGEDVGDGIEYAGTMLLRIAPPNAWRMLSYANLL
jgi:hypothetical protein